MGYETYLKLISRTPGMTKRFYFARKNLRPFQTTILIFIANQVTGFFMCETLGFHGLI